MRPPASINASHSVSPTFSSTACAAASGPCLLPLNWSFDTPVPSHDRCRRDSIFPSVDSSSTSPFSRSCRTVSGCSRWPSLVPENPRAPLGTRCHAEATIDCGNCRVSFGKTQWERKKSIKDRFSLNARWSSLTWTALVRSTFLSSSMLFLSSSVRPAPRRASALASFRGRNHSPKTASLTPCPRRRKTDSVSLTCCSVKPSWK
mmetsp:Transcript_27079/g.53155  ORF Transcript_27079/g.53155 Transcript_27079/m.53155 type:complete len:204 (-) Transcript_27079:335-946(-)